MTRPRVAVALLAAGLSLTPFLSFAGERAVLAQNATPGITTPPVKPETIEQRIASLKANMQITADETDNWNAVAAVMRSNAAAMEQLAASKRAQPSSDVTALDDLLTYQTFAQAHVDGLVKLTASFTVLYNQMPVAQKKIADQVFRSFGRAPAPVKG